MSNLGGYELVGQAGGRSVPSDDQVPVVGPHGTFVPRRRAVADDPPAPPPPCSRHGVVSRRRQFGTLALGLAMLFSMAQVTAWRTAGGQVGGAASGSGRSSDSRSCATTYPSLVPRFDERLLHADLRGDGCQVPVVWDGVAVRFRLDPSAEKPEILAFHDDEGFPMRGDLLLGDWDCDGTDAPTLYLPKTGEIVTFHRMDDSGEPVRRMTRSTGVRMGHAQMATDHDGCDVVEIRPAV
jgi:hypothetical protein